MKKTTVALAGLVVLAGCATPTSYDKRSELRTQVAQKAQEMQSSPSVLAPVARVVESERAHIPVMARKVSEHAWLRATRVTVQTGKDPVPMAEILRALAKQGVTITSELPLDRFQYSGFSLVDVDAETALRSIVATVGLDYQVDAQRRLVVIKPMSSKTWYLSIGNRRSSFAAGGNNAATPSMTNAVAAALSEDSGNPAPAANANSGKTEVTSSDDFWTSLKTELDARLKLMLPEPPPRAAPAAPATAQSLPALPLPPVVPPTGQSPVAAAPALEKNLTAPAVASPAAPAGSDGILSYTSRQVGTYSVNPETGAVTVQAPHWVLQDLEGYFKRVGDMYNTDIVFQGELIMLTTDSASSEGLDISAFAKYANSNYGVVYRNNGLGGVTVAFPSADSLVPSVTAGPGALAGPLLGVQNLVDGLQVFNAYLTNLGRVSTLQKPVLTTTSGVPADFRRTVTRYFNTVSQEAASGGSGSAAVGTKNQLIAQDFGTVLRVNPRMDVSTGLIRAQIELVQTTQTGTQSVAQSVTSGNTVQQVTTQLPIVSRIVYSGEALLRDGDLVVMGGQTEDVENNTRDGVTGLMDSRAVGGVFGKTTRESNRNVFYFALRVNVTKR